MWNKNWDNIIKTAFGQFIWDFGTAWGESADIGVYAAISAANHLAARGAQEFYMNAEITIPTGSQKPLKYAIKKEIERTAKVIRVKELLVESHINPAITRPAVRVMAASCVSPGESLANNRAEVGQDIVMTKWAGLEGMLRIAGERREELAARFTPAFMNRIFGFHSQLPAFKEISIGKEYSAGSIRQVAEGGIMAALWNLSVEAGTGLTVDMRKIPVRQETIEICEYYRLNPYQLTSAGCMLMLSNDGEGLTCLLTSRGIPAAVIGRMTSGNDKILVNGEERRFLERPLPDELTKI